MTGEARIPFEFVRGGVLASCWGRACLVPAVRGCERGAFWPNEANFAVFRVENGGRTGRRSQTKPIGIGRRRETGGWRQAVSDAMCGSRHGARTTDRVKQSQFAGTRPGGSAGRLGGLEGVRLGKDGLNRGGRDGMMGRWSGGLESQAWTDG